MCHLHYMGCVNIWGVLTEIFFVHGNAQCFILVLSRLFFQDRTSKVKLDLSVKGPKLCPLFEILGYEGYMLLLNFLKKQTSTE